MLSRVSLVEWMHYYCMYKVVSEIEQMDTKVANIVADHGCRLLCNDIIELGHRTHPSNIVLRWLAQGLSDVLSLLTPRRAAVCPASRIKAFLF